MGSTFKCMKRQTGVLPRVESTMVRIDGWFVHPNVLSDKYAKCHGKLNGWAPDSDRIRIYWKKLTAAIDDAVASGKLRTRDWDTGLDAPPTSLAMMPARTVVKLQDFCDWADCAGLHGCPKDARELAYALGLAKRQLQPAEDLVLDASTTRDHAPLPLTTGDIAFCFVGLRWMTEKEWKKPLGDKPKWLRACVAIDGSRGVRETRWDPVLIGAALVSTGHTTARSVRAKFQTKPLLLPWFESWKTYEADNIDTP